MAVTDQEPTWWDVEPADGTLTLAELAGVDTGGRRLHVDIAGSIFQVDLATIEPDTGRIILRVVSPDQYGMVPVIARGDLAAVIEDLNHVVGSLECGMERETRSRYLRQVRRMNAEWSDDEDGNVLP